MNGLAQSKYDFAKNNFEFKSEKFELIKWDGVERNSAAQYITSTITRNDNLIVVKSSNAIYEFEIVESQFDGIDKTTFKCKNNTVIKLIPGYYFSFTKKSDIDNEYYFGDLNK